MENKNQIILFEEKQVRRVWYNAEWWFVVEDVIGLLTDSINPKKYLAALRSRDKELAKNYSEIVDTIPVATAGGKQRMTCSNQKGILHLIMFVPSPRAHPLKLWLAQAGEEKLNRSDEIADVSDLISQTIKSYQKPLHSEFKTYLMYDTSRMFYKIGKSKNPKIRERTLQAELPTVALICVIENDIESYLHEKFKIKRIRGEWFRLSKNDVEYIKNYQNAESRNCCLSK